MHELMGRSGFVDEVQAIPKEELEQSLADLKTVELACLSGS
jgi:hypothetical protein